MAKGVGHVDCQVPTQVREWLYGDQGQRHGRRRRRKKAKSSRKEASRIMCIIVVCVVRVKELSTVRMIHLAQKLSLNRVTAWCHIAGLACHNRF